MAYGTYGWYAFPVTAATPLPEPEDHHDLGITEARDNLADIINKAAYTGSVTYISRRGRRLAAIVSAEDAERLERGEDAYLARLASEALAEIEAGAPTIGWEQLKAELEGDR